MVKRPDVVVVGAGQLFDPRPYARGVGRIEFDPDDAPACRAADEDGPLFLPSRRHVMAPAHDARLDAVIHVRESTTRAVVARAGLEIVFAVSCGGAAGSGRAAGVTDGMIPSRR